MHPLDIFGCILERAKIKVHQYETCCEIAFFVHKAAMKKNDCEPECLTWSYGVLLQQPEKRTRTRIKSRGSYFCLAALLPKTSMEPSSTTTACLLPAWTNRPCCPPSLQRHPAISTMCLLLTSRAWSSTSTLASKAVQDLLGCADPLGEAASHSHQVLASQSIPFFDSQQAQDSYLCLQWTFSDPCGCKKELVILFGIPWRKEGSWTALLPLFSLSPLPLSLSLTVAWTVQYYNNLLPITVKNVEEES